MYRFALRSLFARKRRGGLTALAVLAGVALISGAYVFTDTIRSALRDVLSSQAKGADVVVSSRQGLYSSTNPPASIPTSLEQRIAKLPGVASAQGQISDVATIVSPGGQPIKHAGAPTLALSYPSAGLQFVQGRPPSGPKEVALDQATARREHYRLGQEVPVVTGQPARRFRISGIARLGSASIGGATFAVFDLRTAQTLYDKRGLLDVVYVSGAKGTMPQALAREVQPLLPSGIVAQTARHAVDANLGQVEDQLRVLTGGVEAFAYVAMLIGAFVIFNTLAITVTQRAHELALLRALGATRRQVLSSVVLEAAAIGTLPAVAGLGAGLGAALLIRLSFKAVGIDVPSTHLVLEPRTFAVSLGVGIGVTVAAGLAPGIMATRVSPVEAMRATEAPVRRRVPTAILLPALLLAFIGAGVAFTSSGSDSARLAAASVGAVMLVAAAVLLTPLALPYLAHAAGWPLEHRGAVVGRLARENATRTPARTAITASSLMIGLALVLLVDVYIGGARTATRHAVVRTFAADYAIGNADGVSSIPAVSTQAAATAPDVLAASGVRTAAARLAGAGQITAAGIDPSSIAQVYRFDWTGSPAPAVGALGPGDVLLEHDTARATGAHVGSSVRLTTPDGLRAALTVRGIYADRALLHGLALPLQSFDQLFHQSRLQEVLVKLVPDADPAAAAGQLRHALSGLPGVVVRSERQLADKTSSQVNTVLVLFYALLLMSAVMALLGMLNALTLSIHERTRELGVLRAVGMTRAQARELIRDESIITAATGTLIGALLGLGLGWLMTRVLGIPFSVPGWPVALVVAVGLLVGVLAALPAAARAARIDLLTALAYE